MEEMTYLAASLSGIVGNRVQDNLTAWLLPAPSANPAMLELFRLRNREPRQDLVPWYGEFVGKYLTSAALAYRLTHNEELVTVCAEVVRQLADAQSGDGYLGPHPTSEELIGSTKGVEGDDLPWWRGRRKLWDVWGHYHVMLGLLMWHDAAASDLALQTCLKAADHICATFLDGDITILESGESDKNTAVIHIMCLIYQRTSDERYLAMARQIEAAWSDSAGGDYLAAGLAGTPFFETPLPRWESLHAIQGIFELCRITGEKKYRESFENLWWSMLQFDRHNTGGFSSGEQARGNPYDPRPIETCCTIAWMALSIDMLRLTSNSLVADELELSTFNAMLGSQHPSGRWWTYNTPMDGVRKACAHDIVFQARAGSPELNCCSVNGPRGPGFLAQWAVMIGDTGPMINYYGPGTFEFQLPSGERMKLVQTTEYPVSGAVTIDVGLPQSTATTLSLRIPVWSRETSIRVNGEPVIRAGDESPLAGSYMPIAREWHDCDRIEITFDMRPHFWVGEREANGKVSIYRGPILLAYDQRFNAFEADEIPGVDRDGVSLEPVASDLAAASRFPEPWLLVRCTAGGRDLYLCDFATAGMTGTHYRSWLPSKGLEARAFDKSDPMWNSV